MSADRFRERKLFRSSAVLSGAVRETQPPGGWPKVSESDLVQETFLRAKRGFSEFRGRSEGEVVAWLRAILAAQLADVMRHFSSQKRNVRFERQLDARLGESSQMLSRQLEAQIESPSESFSRRERAVLLADALDRLNERQREVIIMRHMEGISFAEVAQRTDRTLDSVKSLWTRAIRNLREQLRDSV